MTKSKDEIILPGWVIAHLYKNYLYEEDIPGRAATEKRIPVPAVAEAPGEAGVPAPVRSDGDYKYLGHNQKKVSVLVNIEQERFLPEAQLEFLTKILGACKMNMADIAILNHAAQPVAIDDLKNQLFPQKLLLFGVDPTEIGLSIRFPLFKVQEYAGIRYLSAPGLGTLNEETEAAKTLKARLWGCLKQLFDL